MVTLLTPLQKMSVRGFTSLSWDQATYFNYNYHGIKSRIKHQKKRTKRRQKASTRKRPRRRLPTTKKKCRKSQNLKVWMAKMPNQHPVGVIIHPIRQRIRTKSIKYWPFYANETIIFLSR